MARHLSDNALVVQSTSPWFAPKSFYWCIDATLREAGFHTHPTTPTCRPSANGASTSPPAARLRRPPGAHPASSTPPTTRAMFRFPPDMRPPVEANHLNSQAWCITSSRTGATWCADGPRRFPGRAPAPVPPSFPARLPATRPFRHSGRRPSARCGCGPRLRDGTPLPTPHAGDRTGVAILGSGIAGSPRLAAGKEGVDDFLLLDGPEPFGNAAGGR